MARDDLNTVPAGRTPADSDLQERVVEINRVAKVVKGGRRFSFTALVVVGDEKSKVGVGYGKANEVPVAIQKGVERARRNLFEVPDARVHHHPQDHRHPSAPRVLLKPASAGTGVIAGGGVRAVLELAGIHDVLSKSLGSQNPINLVKATVAGAAGAAQARGRGRAARAHRRRGPGPGLQGRPVATRAAEPPSEPAAETVEPPDGRRS